MCTLLKTILKHCNVAQMCKMNSSHCRIFCRHLHHIVLVRAAEGAGAQCDAVVRIIHKTEETINVFLAGDDARKSENAPARIVLVDCHVDVALRCNRNHSLQEILQIVPKIILRHCVVLCNHLL